MYRYMCMYIYDIYDNMTIYDKFPFLRGNLIDLIN